MRATILVSVLFLVGWATGAPAPARADPPVICASDLGDTIDALPARVEGDPLDRLKERLVQIRSRPAQVTEERALRQAVSLIQILRTNRITAATSGAGARVVAAVTRSNDPRANH